MVFDKTKSLKNKLNNGKAKAFKLSLKYAPPNKATAPIDEKLANFNSSELKVTNKRNPVITKIISSRIAVCGLNFK